MTWRFHHITHSIQFKTEKLFISGIFYLIPSKLWLAASKPQKVKLSIGQDCCIAGVRITHDGIKIDPFYYQFKIIKLDNFSVVCQKCGGVVF